MKYYYSKDEHRKNHFKGRACSFLLVLCLIVSGISGCGNKVADKEEAPTEAFTEEVTSSEVETEQEAESEVTIDTDDVALQEKVETDESQEAETQESSQKDTDDSEKKPNKEENIQLPDSPAPKADGQEAVLVEQESEAETEKVTTEEENTEEAGKPANAGQGASSSGSSSNSSNREDDKESSELQDAYKLVWEDNFNGTELNMQDWNYEYHEPGWVNNELQEYVDSEENIYLEDGKLVIQAIKTVAEDGTVSYTSGRINTQNKHDYKYGRFEARAKVPSGKGFLPAFWMMPTDESYYGQWPKCGEIDIMEVLGDQLATSHGTLHFGEPHTQSQGGYELASGDFASEFHVFSCEWEPGEIRFYVDGNLFHTENDWFTRKEGFGEVAYPAPYDQPFYMILNLAVGGNWPGNPEPDAVFGDNAQLVVDYVKVYQKDSYDENVQAPVKEIVLRNPDENGNYIINGTFDSEALDDSKDWSFLLAGTGEATAEINDNAVHIESTNAGDLDYSVQLVQPNLPMNYGSRYRLSFEAYADAARTMIVDISAPDKNYIRYLADTKVNLTTTSQTYIYEFDMLNDDDANGRVEFNLGNQASTATVHIANVVLECLGDAEIPEEVKTVLPDGNYVYNGEFQEGSNRMNYWEIENNCDADVTVTNTNGSRELKVAVPDSVDGLDSLIVKQDQIAITGGKTYILSFDAYAGSAKTMQAMIAGKTFESELTTVKTSYKYTFETEEGLHGSVLQFLLGAAGTTYIDNVRIQEDGMFINGDFSNGLVGYEPYVYTSGMAEFLVDSLTENDALCANITNTGSMDWYIQLKQNNITLENGKWYKITFDAKSTVDRKIMYALQKDGTSDNDWTPYSGSQIIDLTGEYQTYSITFKMQNPTDEKTIFSVSMGAVAGKEISTAHTVTLDNIVLEEVEEPEQEETVSGENLIKNGDFAKGGESWDDVRGGEAAASVDFSDNKATYTITNVGTEDWHVQLKQGGITLEKGASYELKLTLESDAARTVKYNLLNPNAGYTWYGGGDAILNANEPLEISQTIDVTLETANTIEFCLSMGQISNVETPASKIEISEVSLVKISGGETAAPDEEIPEAGEKNELITNGDFANGQEGWYASYIDADAGAAGTMDYTNGKAVFDIANAGSQDWHIKLVQNGLTLEKDATYQVAFKIQSSEARTVKLAFLDPSYNWYGGADIPLEAGVLNDFSTTFYVTNDTSDAIEFDISMGKVGDPTPASVIEIDDISLVKVSGGEASEPEESNPEEDETPEVSEDTGLITNGNFANDAEGWASYIDASIGGNPVISDGKAIFDIAKAGSQDWHVHLKQSNLTLEQGATYQIKYTVKSSETRTIKCALQHATNYGWYYGEPALELPAGEAVTIDKTFTVDKETSDNIELMFTMGLVDATTIEISNISLVKVSGEEDEKAQEAFELSEEAALKEEDEALPEESDEEEDESETEEASESQEDESEAEETEPKEMSESEAKTEETESEEASEAETEVTESAE